MKYNNIEEFKLLGHYKLSRDDGSLPAIASFKFYKEMKVSAEKELIGLQTVSGRCVERLINEYGGKESDWNKMAGKVESAKYIFDVHWYEKSYNQYETKLKFKKVKKEKK